MSGMNADDAIDFTDAEWSRFQSIPEQGYSHRHWLNHRNRKVLGQVLAVARREGQAEAWGEGYDAGELCGLTAEQSDHACPINPYRQEADHER